jgi:hypothetical protein
MIYSIILAVVMALVFWGDYASTEKFLRHGVGEENPLMARAQGRFGQWWWIEKFGLNAIAITAAIFSGLVINGQFRSLRGMENYFGGILVLLSVLTIYNAYEILRNWRVRLRIEATEQGKSEEFVENIWCPPAMPWWR